jgi:NAD(P)-dependent dehydrogenase (short-subunit alcohol dehydrogenase family)
VSCVIVTGAGSGIGRAVAMRFVRDGWHVVAVDAEEAALSRAATDADPARFHQVAADITQPSTAGTIIDVAVAAAGGADVLVNNAAVSLGESFLDTRLDTWRRTLEVNLTGPFRCGQAVARWMVEGGRRGRIVNLASTNSLAAEGNAASYVATKGGVLALTRAMAVDLAPHGILVNAVLPGPIRTEGNAATFDEEPYRTGIRKGVPLGRAGTPEEVAGVVAFLAGADATFITGAALVVDGGYLSYARFD